MATNTARKTKEISSWMRERWRPMMAYVYMFVCVFDFAMAPILWAIAQVFQGTMLTVQWTPLTLQGAGLFHAAMGGVLGVAAWGRSKEKLVGIEEVEGR